MRNNFYKKCGTFFKLHFNDKKCISSNFKIMLLKGLRKINFSQVQIVTFHSKILINKYVQKLRFFGNG